MIILSPCPPVAELPLALPWQRAVPMIVAPRFQGERLRAAPFFQRHTMFISPAYAQASGAAPSAGAGIFMSDRPAAPHLRHLLFPADPSAAEADEGHQAMIGARQEGRHGDHRRRPGRQGDQGRRDTRSRSRSRRASRSACQVDAQPTSARTAPSRRTTRSDMLNFPRWKVWGISLICLVGIAAGGAELPARRRLRPAAGLRAARSTINLGLDLAGGSQLLLEAETSDVAKQRLEAMEDVMRAEMRRASRDRDRRQSRPAAASSASWSAIPTQLDAAVERSRATRSGQSA